jgi:acetoin utilization deacetylase AcuC-like enzyme
VFNNIAIASVYLAEKGEKVLIVDIDMHRGDGTSDAVTQLNKILENKLYYFSINQQGAFPGAAIDEGNIHNIYVNAGISEQEYISTMTKELTATLSRFKPTIIAISAGFDSFETDKNLYGEKIGAGLLLTKKTVIELKKIISNYRYFAVLEGGYNPESVVQGVAAFLGVALKEEKKEVKPAIKEPITQKASKKNKQPKVKKAKAAKQPKRITKTKKKRAAPKQKKKIKRHTKKK